jgi:cyanate permease
MVNALASGRIPTAVLAHQGGWDEVLLVLGPMVLVAGLVWLARRRAIREESRPDETDVTSPRG